MHGLLQGFVNYLQHLKEGNQIDKVYRDNSGLFKLTKAGIF